MQLKRHRCWGILLFVFLWHAVGSAQIPSIPGISAPAAQAPLSQPKDPLRRETPQSATLRFVRAAHRGDYATAARYLELPTIRQRQEGPELAKKLLTLMDTSLVGSIATLSQSPEGFLDDSPDPNVEVVGRLEVQDKQIPFLLVRVTEKDAGPVWLVSQQTLDQVPGLYELAGAPVLDQYFPAFLADHRAMGISAGRWIAWLLSIPLALAIGAGVTWLMRWILRTVKHRGALQWSGIDKPITFIVAILFHAVLVLLIGIPLYYRVYYFRTLGVFLVVCLAWFGTRILDKAHTSSALRMSGKEAQSFLQLGYHLFNVGLIVGAALCILGILGFNTKTMLAGLGIGGIAIALAAQKTLENLLGGITLVMDNAIYIGDDCVISGRYVTIRNVGLRSTAATTREGTDIWFPNGMLVQSSIENLSRRNKFLIFTTLSLSRECSLDQLQCVIEKVREVLYSHPRVEQQSARFRLAGIDGAGYQVELFAYILSRDAADFSAIQEDILFRITRTVEATGGAWAVPIRLNYTATNQRMNEEKAAEAQRTVQKWQDKNENPFPNFSAERMAELRGTLPYPSNGTPSGVRNPNESSYEEEA